jgi:hypothetical protein
MQHATLPGRDAACRTSDGRDLFGCEFALLHFSQNPITRSRESVQIWTVLRYGSQYPWSVRMTDVTPQLLLAVPCPTCGVDAGKHCLLHTGEPSPDPHIDRKLDAAEAIETENIPT